MKNCMWDLSSSVQDYVQKTDKILQTNNLSSLEGSESFYPWTSHSFKCTVGANNEIIKHTTSIKLIPSVADTLSP